MSSSFPPPEYPPPEFPPPPEYSPFPPEHWNIDAGTPFWEVKEKYHDLKLQYLYLQREWAKDEPNILKVMRHYCDVAYKRGFEIEALKRENATLKEELLECKASKNKKFKTSKEKK